MVCDASLPDSGREILLFGRTRKIGIVAWCGICGLEMHTSVPEGCRLAASDRDRITGPTGLEQLRANGFRPLGMPCPLSTITGCRHRTPGKSKAGCTPTICIGLELVAHGVAVHRCIFPHFRSRGPVIVASLVQVACAQQYGSKREGCGRVLLMCCLLSGGLGYDASLQSEFGMRS